MKLTKTLTSVTTAALLLPFVWAEENPISKGLLLDLNADVGLVLEDENRVASWKNQVEGSGVDLFVKQDEGRDVKIKGKKPGIGSGRPTLKPQVAAINDHSALIFKEQELVNHQEDAFDHLTQGAGYTWFSVVCAYEQRVGKKDVNSFFGNLTNGKPYAGLWGNFMDDNRVWMGSRTGADFGVKRKKGQSALWHPKLNPLVVSKEPVEVGKYNLIMGRMGAGTETVPLELFVNSTTPVDKKTVPVVIDANPSKMAVGQERDATNHPGFESFDGEITRLMIYERPLTDEELQKVAEYLNAMYGLVE